MPPNSPQLFVFFTGRVLPEIINEKNLLYAYIAHEEVIELKNNEMIRLLKVSELAYSTLYIPWYSTSIMLLITMKPL